MTEKYTWEQARETIKEASKEKDTIELSAIFSCFSWDNLKTLEISRNGDARIALSNQNKSKSTLILVPYESQVKEINNLKNKKIKAKLFNPKEKFPISEAYDLVYAEWISHSWLENENFLKQMLQASKKYFLIVMPSLNSDDTKLASINNPKEKDRRKKLIETIKSFLKKDNWQAHFKEKYLPLSFPDKETTKKTFVTLAFNNNLTKEQEAKLDSFLTEDRIKNFNDSFYIILGEKNKPSKPYTTRTSST